MSKNPFSSDRPSSRRRRRDRIVCSRRVRRRRDPAAGDARPRRASTTVLPAAPVASAAPAAPPPAADQPLTDEGMWLTNDFPADRVAKQYGFTPTQEWLDHVRLSSVRLAGGCSGSLVSADGLVMTNHHCAHSCIEQLSTAKKDFVKEGFFAKTDKDEVKCPEIEVNQLTGIDDVTARVRTRPRGSPTRRSTTRSAPSRPPSRRSAPRATTSAATS